MTPAICVVIHDVAPATQPACEALIAQLEGVAGVRLSLLVVPRYHDAAAAAPGGTRPAPVPLSFERWMGARRARGDEPVLHGWNHLDDGAPPRTWSDAWLRRRYTAGEGEFAALSRPEAARRLHAGLRWFARRGWPLRGFVAPAWLLGPGAWQALCASPLEYTCTLTRLVALPGASGRDSVAWPAWSLVYSARSAWRRAGSVAWTRLLERRLRDAPLLRLELHPADAPHAALVGAALGTLARALAQGREPITLGEAVARLRRGELGGRERALPDAHCQPS